MQLTLVLLAGMLLGAVFFGGLWWTVQRGLASAKPALWFGASLALRAAFALGGFYLVARGGWKPVLVCLAGFIVARMTATRLAAASTGIPLSPGSDVSTSHPTKPASGQVAGYLPQAGERDAASRRDSQTRETGHAP